ncbi:MAG: GIY-YIG nuclease family protein [Candidatus Methanosuratincola sp.]|jgi:histidyl-tRNA synthetase|nr:GIY-YIG nuclease family protein [Candidatus Methanosuratincola sp.]
MGRSGVYALVLGIPGEARLLIGRGFDIPRGTCVYCGSAMGPGGVESRVARHLRIFAGGTAGRPHWHIDRLLTIASSVTAVSAHSQRSMECALASALEARGMAPVPGFGNTDCRSGCRSHLLRTQRGEQETVLEVVEAMRGIGLDPWISERLWKSG